MVLESEDVSNSSDEDTSVDEIEDNLPAAPMNPRLAREMKKLGGWFNPTTTTRVTGASRQVAATVTPIVASSSEGREEAPETANIMMDRHHSVETQNLQFYTRSNLVQCIMWKRS
jgi:hypothetical protein